MENSLKLLTVGDGDLSYSLALARAFPSLEITATTFISETELFDTYAAARRSKQELLERGARVLHGIDAATLHRTEPALGAQHAVVFNHPHLGLGDMDDEAAHARRHHRLIAHYLHSAAQILLPGGEVHLGLCGRQPRNWGVHLAAERVGLEVLEPLPTGSARSLTAHALACLGEPVHAEQSWGARRKFRYGKLGSRHWLGKFGYEHRRCEGDADMDVSDSTQWLFVLGEASRGKRREVLETVSVAEYASNAAASSDANGAASADASLNAKSDTNSDVNADANADTNADTSADTNADTSADTNADTSAHPNAYGNVAVTTSPAEPPAPTRFQCRVCDMVTPSAEALRAHLAAPATPDETGSAHVVCPETGRMFGSRYALGKFQESRRLFAAVPATDAETINGPGPILPRGSPCATFSATDSVAASERNTTLQTHTPPKKAAGSIMPESSGFSGLGDTYEAKVGDDGEGERLRRWVRREGALPGLKRPLSKPQLALAVREARLCVNGAPAEDSRILHSGDVVSLTLPPESQMAADFAARMPELTIELLREATHPDVLFWNTEFKGLSERESGGFGSAKGF